MKVLITGANGMVARATARYCESVGDTVVGLRRDELDISDIENVRSQISAHMPDAVINCAAYTNVDGAETESEKAFAANAVGVGNLAVVTRELGRRFVTISTDYVFDGSNDGFYTQRDTPLPLSVYGETKRRGELAALEKNARSIIVRSGWIYGTGGTNFLSVMPKLLADGKRIKAIGDSFGTPTFAEDLAMRLRELAELDLPAVYHVTNSGEGTSYLGFARALCRIGGFDASLIDPVSHDELVRPARRPLSSKLTCLFSERFGLAPLPGWEAALERFLTTR